MVRDFLERHRVGISSFVAIVMPLFLLYVHGRSSTVRKTTVFEVGLMTLTSPVQEAAANMLSGLDDVWAGYIALADVEKDNERLRREAELLTSEALRAKKLDEENLRLTIEQQTMEAEEKHSWDAYELQARMMVAGS